MRGWFAMGATSVLFALVIGRLALGHDLAAAHLGRTGRVAILNDDAAAEPFVLKRGVISREPGAGSQDA